MSFTHSFFIFQMEEILLYSSLVQEKKINSFIFLIEIELNAIKQRERDCKLFCQKCYNKISFKIKRNKNVEDFYF